MLQSLRLNKLVYFLFVVFNYSNFYIAKKALVNTK